MQNDFVSLAALVLSALLMIYLAFTLLFPEKF